MVILFSLGFDVKRKKKLPANRAKNAHPPVDPCYGALL